MSKPVSIKHQWMAWIAILCKKIAEDDLKKVAEYLVLCLGVDDQVNAEDREWQQKMLRHKRISSHAKLWLHRLLGEEEVPPARSQGWLEAALERQRN